MKIMKYITLTEKGIQTATQKGFSFVYRGIQVLSLTTGLGAKVSDEEAKRLKTEHPEEIATVQSFDPVSETWA